MTTLVALQVRNDVHKWLNKLMTALVCTISKLSLKDVVE